MTKGINIYGLHKLLHIVTQKQINTQGTSDSNSHLKLFNMMVPIIMGMKTMKTSDEKIGKFKSKTLNKGIKTRTQRLKLRT